MWTHCVEPNGLNTLKYQAAQRLHLRNILFNNPHISEIRFTFPHDTNRWDQWLKRATGLAQPQFDYLRDRFHTFDDFAKVVSLIRSSSIEVNSNKRWTSKLFFLWPTLSLRGS